MNTANDTALAELLSELKHAGIEKIVRDGDQLRYYPKSAMTPELGQRVRASKAELLVALSPGTTLGDADDSSANASETPAEIRVVLHGDELQFSCPSPELRDVIEANRARIQRLIDTWPNASNDSDWPGDAVDPGEPCVKCGSLNKWWDIVGGEHCLACEHDKVLRSEWASQRAAWLRRNRGT